MEEAKVDSKAASYIKHLGGSTAILKFYDALGSHVCTVKPLKSFIRQGFGMFFFFLQNSGLKRLFVRNF